LSHPVGSVGEPDRPATQGQFPHHRPHRSASAMFHGAARLRRCWRRRCRTIGPRDFGGHGGRHMSVALTSYLLSPGDLHFRRAARSPTAFGARLVFPAWPSSFFMVGVDPLRARRPASGSWCSRDCCRVLGGRDDDDGPGRPASCCCAPLHKSDMVAAMSWLLVAGSDGSDFSGRRSAA